MTQYIEDIDISFSISIYCVVSSKNIDFFDISRYSKMIAIYRNILNIIVIFATDSLLHRVTAKKDYKYGELMVS